MIFFPKPPEKLWETAVNLQGCKASEAPPKVLPPLLLLPKVRAFLPSERFPAPTTWEGRELKWDAIFSAYGMEMGGLFPHDLGIRGHFFFFAMDIPNWINWYLGCWFGLLIWLVSYNPIIRFPVFLHQPKCWFGSTCEKLSIQVHPS